MKEITDEEIKNFILQIVKTARRPKRVFEGSELDGKIIYQHKKDNEIVDEYLPVLKNIISLNP